MSKTAGTTVQTSRTSLPPEQQPYFLDLLSRARGLLERGGPQFYPGSTVAPFAPAELEAFSHIERAAPIAAGVAQDWALPALGQALTATNVAGNPYVRGMVEASTRPIMQQLTEQVLPGLRQSGVGMGQRGGSRESLASAQAVERAARAMGDTAAQIYGSAYQQGLGAMLSGLQMIPTIQNTLMAPATWLSSVGEAQRGMEQARINEAIARWMHEQNLPWQTLSEYANLISVPMGGVSQAEVIGTPPDKLAQVISLVLGGLSSVPWLVDLFKDIFGIGKGR